MICITKIGDFLRELRGKRSLRDIQKISGVSYTYLRSIEKGVDPRSGNTIIPTPETLEKLARAYNHSYTDLMEKAGYLQPSKDYQKHLKTNLEAALIKITKDNEFIPEVNEEIQRIKDYVDLLEEDQELTPNFLRELVSNADWQQEWIQDVVSLVDNTSRNYEPTNNDLSKLLLQPDITYKNKVLTEEDRQRILGMLDIMFPEYTKEKRDPK